MENIIEFRSGIPAFEEYKKYRLMQVEGSENLYCLQSIEEESLSFILSDPFSFAKDYAPRLSEKTVKELEIESQEDVLLLTILVIPDDVEKMTTNLAAPIVINIKKRLGKQVILSDRDYPVKYPVILPSAKENV